MIVIRIVVKFGGTSIQNPERINEAVQSIANKINKDMEILVVVSAMGDTTDRLIFLLSDSTKSNFKQKDYADFISFGERMSAQLFASSLKANGIKAVAFDPSKEEFPIITDSDYLEAGILSEQSKRQCRQYL